MKHIIIIPLLFLGLFIKAQKTEKDSLVRRLEEIKITSIIKKKIETDMKMSVSVDEFLSSSSQISFIKRGAYVSEPMLNNMSSERSTVTIDGMHVFGACTDKMDSITSYVETNNLSTIDIKSGQEGGLHGSTVAGSIDLKRKSIAFSKKTKWRGIYQSGYELNNQQFFNLGNVSFLSNKIVVDGSVSYRKAGNYSHGNDNKVNHSQFKKFNSSLGMAYKTGELSLLRVNAIFDLAKDVGYPALPMDLWLSRALISSVSYKQLFEEGLVRVFGILKFTLMPWNIIWTIRPDPRIWYIWTCPVGVQLMDWCLKLICEKTNILLKFN